MIRLLRLHHVAAASVIEALILFGLLRSTGTVRSYLQLVAPMHKQQNCLGCNMAAAASLQQLSTSFNASMQTQQIYLR